MGLGAQGGERGGGKREGGEATRGRLEPKIKAPFAFSDLYGFLTGALFVG